MKSSRAKLKFCTCLRRVFTDKCIPEIGNLISTLAFSNTWIPPCSPDGTKLSFWEASAALLGLPSRSSWLLLCSLTVCPSQTSAARSGLLSENAASCSVGTTVLSEQPCQGLWAGLPDHCSGDRGITTGAPPAGW